MANERFALRCVECLKSVYLGKSMGSDVELGREIEFVERFTFDHLMSCHGGVEQESPKAIFEVIPEIHPGFGNR